VHAENVKPVKKNHSPSTKLDYTLSL
jgi:hypothetical protein